MTGPNDPNEEGRTVRFSEDDVAERDRDPLADLADRVTDRDGATGNDDLDELFDRQNVTGIDSERLWERLESEVPAEPLPDEADREVREIDARAYCHQCEHFAKPPDVGCTRERTTILEMPSMGRFRVADCPVVLEDEEL